MKKVILSFGIMMCLAVVGKSQTAVTPAPPDPNAPVMTFVQDTINYGTIEHNADGYREFKFTNTGKEPLIIKEAHGSCGCTIPTYPKDPIKPGETSAIKVHYATDRIGQFVKTVTVNSNATNATVVLHIMGTVKPDAPTPTPAATTPAK
jgi:hypothetical protein